MTMLCRELDGDATAIGESDDAGRGDVQLTEQRGDVGDEQRLRVAAADLRLPLPAKVGHDDVEPILQRSRDARPGEADFREAGEADDRRLLAAGAPEVLLDSVGADELLGPVGVGEWHPSLRTPSRAGWSPVTQDTRLPALRTRRRDTPRSATASPGNSRAPDRSGSVHP